MIHIITEKEWHVWHDDTLARVARENAVHISIAKRIEGIPFSGMWVGDCTCGKVWKFWFFGATLGYGLEHIRREIAGSL
jgi:hypothetical protein